MDASAAFVKPQVSVSRLGSRLLRYLSDSWSGNAWEMLFLHLNATFKLESKDAEVAQMVTRCEN